MNDGMTKFIVWSHGDPTIGDYGQRADVSLWVDPKDMEHLEFVRRNIVNAFTVIFDGRVIVQTENELNDEDKDD